MKKVLIVSHAMELGGVEKSLLGLLNAFDDKKYQIDLFLLRHEGELFEYIPKNVNILPEIPAYTVLARPLIKVVKEKHILLAIARTYGKVKAILYEKFHSFQDSGVELEYSHKYTCAFMPKIQKKKEYDIAISFLTPHYFVWKRVKAKKKIAWIHTDYSRIQINIKSEEKMWSAYNYIVSISKDAARSFRKVFPMLENKIVIIENILPVKIIQQQMNEFDITDEMKGKGIKLLSIGRYCKAKNFDNIPDICKKILKSGIEVTWYIIGYGSDEVIIKKHIIEKKMQNNIILLGKKENPYPYIKACDVYVQPSRYEGKSVAVREAQLLGKPVIITNYETAQSQLENGVDGFIVPLNNEACAEQMVSILKDKIKLNKISNVCSARDYSNQGEIKKLYALIEQRKQ